MVEAYPLQNETRAAVMLNEFLQVGGYMRSKMDKQ